MKQARMAIAFAAVLACGAAIAHEAPAADAKARYEKERAACIGGRSHQDQATCLREAAAAFAEARRGRLEAAGPDYQRNAALRCAPLPDDQRKDCEARMRGEGSVRGSVEQGGIYRETVTVEVGEPKR